MNRIIEKMMVLLLIVISFGCKAKPTDHGQMTKTVTEQRLLNYSPLRRLTYRNACGENGPLQICVERITVSETASMVELRVKNRSEAAYQPGRSHAASLRLATDNAQQLRGSIDKLASIAPFSEQYLYCRLDGQAGRELKKLILGDSVVLQSAHGSQRPIIIDLDG